MDLGPIKGNGEPTASVSSCLRGHECLLALAPSRGRLWDLAGAKLGRTVALALYRTQGAIDRVPSSETGL